MFPTQKKIETNVQLLKGPSLGFHPQICQYCAFLGVNALLPRNMKVMDGYRAYNGIFSLMCQQWNWCIAPVGHFHRQQQYFHASTLAKQHCWSKDSSLGIITQTLDQLQRILDYIAFWKPSTNVFSCSRLRQLVSRLKGQDGNGANGGQPIDPESLISNLEYISDVVQTLASKNE